jgi:phytoene/squalene synthetase
MSEAAHSQRCVQWNRRLDDIWRGRPWDALDATLCDVREKFPTMSIEPFKDMIAGMVMDVPGMGRMRYETFDDLYLYCYRVAGTVGLMTLPVMGTAEGYTEKQATEPALALGIALQVRASGPHDVKPTGALSTHAPIAPPDPQSADQHPEGCRRGRGEG